MQKIPPALITHPSTNTDTPVHTLNSSMTRAIECIVQNTSSTTPHSTLESHLASFFEAAKQLEMDFGRASAVGGETDDSIEEECRMLEQEIEEKNILIGETKEKLRGWCTRMEELSRGAGQALSYD